MSAAKFCKLILNISFFGLLLSCGKNLTPDGAKSVVDSDTKTVELISPGSQLFTVPENTTCSGQVIKYDFEKKQLSITKCNGAGVLTTSVTDFSGLKGSEAEKAQNRMNDLLKNLGKESFVSSFKTCPKDFDPSWVRVINFKNQISHYVKKEESCGNETPKEDDRIKGVVSNFEETVKSLHVEQKDQTSLTKEYLTSQWSAL